MATTVKKPKIAYKVFPPEKSGLEVQTYLVSACDNLVLREKNKKTVIGQVVNDEFVMLNDDIISTAEKYGFKPDETMLAEQEEGDEEVEEEGDEEVEEEGDEEVEEEGDEEVEGDEEGDEEVEVEGDEEGDEEVEIEEEGDEEVGEEEVDGEELKKDVVEEDVELNKVDVELNKVDVVVEESVDRETGSEVTCKASQDFQENMLGLEGNLSSMIKTLNSLTADTCKTLDARDKTIASLEDQSSKKDSVIEELRQELAKTKEDLTTAKKKLDGLKQLLS